MKIFSTTLVLFFSFSAWSYDAVELFPLQLQFRYEDTSSQAKETVSYQSFSAYVQSHGYRGGLSYSRHQDETGNLSLNIQTEKKEFFAIFGYQLFHIEGQTQKLSLDIFADVVLGLTQTFVSTTLLGSTSLTTSDKEWVYGIGSSVVGRLSYFIMQTDFHVLRSKAFSPQNVPEVTFKAGLSIPF